MEGAILPSELCTRTEEVCNLLLVCRAKAPNEAPTAPTRWVAQELVAEPRKPWFSSSFFCRFFHQVLFCERNNGARNIFCVSTENMGRRERGSRDQISCFPTGTGEHFSRCLPAPQASCHTGERSLPGCQPAIPSLSSAPNLLRNGKKSFRESKIIPSRIGVPVLHLSVSSLSVDIQRKTM